VIPRLRLAFLIGTASAAVIACNAILGVTDVTLKDRDGGGEEEIDGEVGGEEDEGGGPQLDPNHAILALGFNHACARMPDSTVKCWGDNSAAQVGDGTSMESGTRPDVLTPQPVPGIKDAKTISAGLSHTCVVHKTGAVSCWGANYYGQLGDGTQKSSSSPMKVKDLPKAVDVAGGTSFTCALLEDKSVSCWGANYSGQLGDGAKIDRVTPGPVQKLEGVVSISTATDHACAVLSNGDVKCWGGNSEGQLGNGTLKESLEPIKVSSISDVSRVAAAPNFTCALQKSGKVYCWGNNQFGQLGNGAPNDDPNPSPTLVTSINDATFLWTGYEHVCAVRKNGAIMCWGSAGEGQLGKGAVPDGSASATPGEVVGAKPAVAVWTGGNRSCSLSQDKSAYCWGINTTGQLGNGTRERAYAAMPVLGIP
jgi:alpha-tubulin suppressor-like RCC1 family protein